MTAVTDDTRGRRIVTTVRIHAANPWVMIVTPVLITLAIFVLNYAIWRTIVFAVGENQIEPRAFEYNGGVTWVLVYMLVLAVQAMNQSFSFVVGLGATRRDYFVGTVLVFAALSLFYGVGIALMAGVENATAGWGVDGHFFAPGPFQHLPLWELAFVYTLALALFMCIGAVAGAMFVRWQSTGVIVFFGVLATILVVGNFLLFFFDAWQSLFDFLGARSWPELALLSLPITLTSAAIAFRVLLRATPKG